MSDDPVKRAIEELQELVRCRCLPAYTVRKLRDPECDCDSAEDVKVVVDRIEELEAKLRSMALDCLSADGQADEAYQAQLAAEAKLQEAEDFVRRTIRYAGNNGDDFLADKGRAFLAELKGDTDE